MARKGMRPRVAALGERVEGGTAGIRQTEKPRRLVVRFAGSVVVRAAEDTHARGRLDGDELRVPAGDEQRKKRKGRRLGTIEKWREHVPMQVIDAVEWAVQRESVRLGGRHADDEAAD